MTPDTTTCAQQVRTSDPDRFLATMTAPPEHRGRLFVLYAFNLEVARAPWVTKERMIAEMRLQWWRDALEEIYTGTPARRHDVVTPLAALIQQHDLPRPLFDAMIDARSWDIYTAPHKDQQALEAYLKNTAGSLLELSVRALSGSFDPARLPALHDHAYATGLAALLRACPDLERAGRFPLVDGRPGAIKSLAADGLLRLARAKSALRQSPKSLHPALRCGWMAKHTLQQAKADPTRVASATLASSPARRKLTLLVKHLSGNF